MKPACDHSIVRRGDDRLSLLDEDNKEIVAARRTGGVWRISADGVADETETDVHAAVTKMTRHALLHKKGTVDTPGFSTWVPHEVRKLDGEDSFNAWKTSVGLHDLKY